MTFECFACRPSRQVGRVGKMKIQQPLRCVYMQSQGNDLTLLVNPLIYFFFFSFFVVDLQESLCLVIIFQVTTIRSQEAAHRIMFCARLYTQTSF